MPAVLTLLRIKNLALVEELEWQMSPGFIAVTGETGAGKSIIIGALQLLLGERADKSLIRTGADLCTVEAVFSGAELQKLNPQLGETGIDPCDNDLILKRTLSLSGTNRQFINGSPTTLSVLKNLGDELVDLHGPHDHQSLLSPERQLSLLDSFARAEEQLDEYQKHYRNCRRCLSNTPLSIPQKQHANRSSICSAIRSAKSNRRTWLRAKKKKLRNATNWRVTANG